MLEVVRDNFSEIPPQDTSWLTKPKDIETLDFSPGDVVGVGPDYLASSTLGRVYYLQPEEFEQMTRIYEQNYQAYPRLQAALAESFKKTTRQDHQEVNNYYILKHKGKIVAFNVFTDLVEDREGRNHQYFSAFNVAPDYQGQSLGSFMIEQSFDKEAEVSVIEADYKSTIAPITGKYI